MIRVSSNCTKLIFEVVHIEHLETCSLKKTLRVETSEEKEEDKKTTASLDVP